MESGPLCRGCSLPTTLLGQPVVRTLLLGDVLLGVKGCVLLVPSDTPAIACIYMYIMCANIYIYTLCYMCM